jgi:hypothetical protein
MKAGVAPRVIGQSKGHPDQDPDESVIGRIPQKRAPTPEDEAAIKEYRERKDLTAAELAFFDGLSREDQLFFLNDPGKHRKVFPRG